MSAGQSSRLMGEKLNDALGNGRVPKGKSRKMQVHLQLGARKHVLLVESDGTVTQEGRHVYRATGVPPANYISLRATPDQRETGKELPRSTNGQHSCGWQRQSTNRKLRGLLQVHSR